jgi:hypothetical protein
MNGSRISLSRPISPRGYAAFDHGGNPVPFARAQAPFRLSLFDLTGRRLLRLTADSTSLNASGQGRFARGRYVFRVSSHGKTRAKVLSMTGSPGIIDTLHLPR